jgi:hypothetical protein
MTLSRRWFFILLTLTLTIGLGCVARTAASWRPKKILSGDGLGVLGLSRDGKLLALQSLNGPSDYLVVDVDSGTSRVLPY